MTWGQCFALQAQEPTHDFPCRKCDTNHWHTISHRGRGFIFLVCCRYKVKKGKNLKALRQNNAVLRRAARSKQKQRWIELIRGCSASRRVLNICPKVVEGGDPHYLFFLFFSFNLTSIPGPERSTYRWYPLQLHHNTEKRNTAPESRLVPWSIKLDRATSIAVFKVVICFGLIFTILQLVWQKTLEKNALYLCLVFQVLSSG